MLRSSSPTTLDLPADCYYSVFGENRIVCRRGDQLALAAEQLAKRPDAHVVIEDRELVDMAPLSVLPEMLTGLILPITAKPKKNLPALARFSVLNRLLVCAKVTNTDVIARMSVHHVPGQKNEGAAATEWDGRWSLLALRAG